MISKQLSCHTTQLVELVFFFLSLISGSLHMELPHIAYAMLFVRT